MTQITLSKSTYLKEAKKLSNYERYLPSLDLKRQQLMMEKNKAKLELRDVEEQLQKLNSETAQQLQMLANAEIELKGLVTIKEIECVEQNLMGVHLPQLKALKFEQITPGLLTQPHWVDLLVIRLKQAAELQIQFQIQEKRVAVLEKAARKATQRVNLVAKVLIPQAQQNMRKISIFLSDNERAAVVRSKLAKQKKQAVSFDEVEP